MKAASVPCLSLLVLLAATSMADDKTVSKPVRPVRIEKCHITLIDQVILSFDRAGILKTLEFKEGEPIEKGVLLALLADEVAQANLAVAEKEAANQVEFEFAHVAKKAAESEHKRMLNANQIAVEKGGKEPVAQLDIDKSRLAADKANLSIQQAEHEMGLKKLKANVSAAELATYSIHAGFDGVVHKIFKKKGEAVRQGDPVIEILNTNRVRVEGYVSPADLRFARQGAKVRVWPTDADRVPGEQEFLEGEITFVALVSDPIDRMTRIYAEVENRGNILRGGHEAIMEIQVGDQPVPAASQPKVEAKTPPSAAGQQ
jgi:multidrug efflux pump subunit AcrA (membrane-fusion protein)